MTARKPFTRSERQVWLGLTTLMTHLTAALDTHLERSVGMTHFDYCVLEALAEAPGRQLQMNNLAFKTNASLSRLSHVVGKLEQRQWLTRHIAPGRRRGRLATLTDAGTAAVTMAAPIYLDAVRGLVLDGIDDRQTRQLNRLIQELLRQLVKGTEAGIGAVDGTANRRAVAALGDDGRSEGYTPTARESAVSDV